jgi:hypothetical protein
MNAPSLLYFKDFTRVKFCLTCSCYKIIAIYCISKLQKIVWNRVLDEETVFVNVVVNSVMWVEGWERVERGED